MFGGDDDEDEKDLNATRYPCMPSLVALQQMRNRLHLAHTGKKLMKWTALATGRKLRKLAKTLQESYKSFREEMELSFMLLARIRYANPYFNEMVLENVGNEAQITVDVTYKSMSGVKSRRLRIIDRDFTTYAYLGIGRGGESIVQAREHWHELVKKIIYMCQQRLTFITFELAHKNATKRQNVLSRVVIPRTLASMAYILGELEEIDREEFFRIKKILANKYKHKQQKRKCSHGADVICPNCPKPQVQETEKIQETVKTDILIEKSKCVVCEKVISQELYVDYDDRVIEIDKIKTGPMCKHCIAIISTEKDATIVESISNMIREEIVEELITSAQEPQPLAIEEIPDTDIVTDYSEGSSAQIQDVESIPSVKPSGKKMEELGLGLIEIEYEEIIKIVRTRNSDGTVTEQKKIIKRKKERRAPLIESESNNLIPAASINSSNESNETGKSKNEKTIGFLNLRKPMLQLNLGKAKSLPWPQSNSYHIIQKRLSLIGVRKCKSSNFFIDINYLKSQKAQENNLLSNSESEEFIELHDIQHNLTYNSNLSNNGNEPKYSAIILGTSKSSQSESEEMTSYECS